MDTTILLLHSYHQNPGSNRILYKYTNRPEKSFIILVVVVIVPGPKMCLSNQKRGENVVEKAFSTVMGCLKLLIQIQLQDRKQIQKEMDNV